MLQAAANITPRGVYVCGNTTTTSGLTVTLTKEGGSGDYALEAGALVLADQGLYIVPLKIRGEKNNLCKCISTSEMRINYYVISDFLVQ